MLILFYNNNIDCLRATFPLSNFKFYILTFIETLKTFSYNPGVMNKNIITFFGLNKAKTFSCIKPFNFSFHGEIG